MKTKLFAALLVLVSTGLLGCTKRPYFGNIVMPVYPALCLLAIELIDQQDQNISYVAGRNTIGEAFYPEDTSKKIDTKIWSYILGKESVCYYLLEATTDNNCIEPPYAPFLLRWNIKCKEVFGDDEVRTLESNWLQEEGKDVWTLKCTSFTLEGETYYPELKNGYWTSRVVVSH